MKRECKKEWVKPILMTISSIESHETVLKVSQWGDSNQTQGYNDNSDSQVLDQ